MIFICAYTCVASEHQKAILMMETYVNAARILFHVVRRTCCCFFSLSVSRIFHSYYLISSVLGLRNVKSAI